MEFTEIIYIYNNPDDVNYINSTYSDKGIFIEYIDICSKSGKKKAKELMEEWGSRKSPFAIIKNKDKVVKCFYSEAENVLNKLIELL